MKPKGGKLPNAVGTTKARSGVKVPGPAPRSYKDGGEVESKEGFKRGQSHGKEEKGEYGAKKRR